jgi:hypothetical protein
LFGLLVVIGLCLSSCGKPPGSGESVTPSAAQAPNDTGNALDALAAESGVIGETYSEDVAGSYGRAYEGGDDRLCLAANGGSGEGYRLGVEIRIGQEEYCRGRGSARRSGDTVILTLAEGRCIITAQYEGDRLVLPGAVDRACAALCSERGSLAGVTFPRISSDDAMTGSDGKSLCGG